MFLDYLKEQTYSWKGIGKVIVGWKNGKKNITIEDLVKIFKKLPKFFSLDHFLSICGTTLIVFGDILENQTVFQTFCSNQLENPTKTLETVKF